MSLKFDIFQINDLARVVPADMEIKTFIGILWWATAVVGERAAAEPLEPMSLPREPEAVAAGDDDTTAHQLSAQLQKHWSLPTALAFLAWFVFAPQCISTIAVTRRETNGWKWPGFMLAYLFALAYVFAGITYWSAIALGF